MKRRLLVIVSLWLARNLGGADCASSVHHLATPLALSFAAPQGIAHDAADGTFWVTSGLSTIVRHLDSRLRAIGSFEAELPPLPGLLVPEGLSGIAIHPSRSTLLLTRPVAQEIWEFEKDGTPTGLVICLDLPRPPTRTGEPFPKGLAFDPEGDGGAGSIWVVEAVMTAIYEVALDGRVLGGFCHPQDPDGCPGQSRAGHAADIELVRDPDSGEAAALEIIGGESYRDQLLEVDRDGVTTGVVYSLAAAGGRLGGFTRAPFTDPATLASVDALYVTVESTAEIHILSLEPPRIRPPLDALARTRSGEVEMLWRNPQSYDGIEIRREGERIASLAGEARSFIDAEPPHGILEYEIIASRGECSASAPITVVFGAGEVLRAAYFDGRQAIDIAADLYGLLWVTFTAPVNRIAVLDEGLEVLTEIDSPFTEEGAQISGIAADLAADTFFIYEAVSNSIIEIDPAGTPVAHPFPSGVETSEEHPAAVTGFLFDPEGDEGRGSFWYLDLTSAAIEERSRSGALLERCFHPDHAVEPAPPESRIGSYHWGLSASPGAQFRELEVSGGRMRDGGATRIFRLDPRSGRRLAEEISLAAVGELAAPYGVAVHRSDRDGREVLHGLISSPLGSWIFELRADPPPVPHIADLTCRQETDDLLVTVEFLPPEDIDAVEVERDGALVATLPSGTTSWVDSSPAPGLHTWSLRAVRAGERSDDRSCTIRVGSGSIARRAFTNPVSFLHQVAHDPREDLYWTASWGWMHKDRLFAFDRDLALAREIPSPFKAPRQVAAIAVRETAGPSEILCLGWNPGAAHGTQSSFPLVAIDAEGNRLRQTTVAPPPAGDVLVPFPSGLAWDSSTDTLWLLERNARRISNISLDGAVIASYPHPCPPLQDGVYNYGLSIDAARGALYVSAAGPFDHRITKLVEVTRRGEVTGVEIQLDSDAYPRSEGFALAPDGCSVLVSSRAGNVSDLVLYRAFAPLPSVLDLRAERAAGGAHLRWTNAGEYHALEVYRGRDRAAVLPAGASEWLDPSPPSCGIFYRVVPLLDGQAGPGSLCEIPAERPFIRGDVEEDGRLTISDAIAILLYLFVGADAPACLDACDADDDGQINITDPVRLLNFLFLGSASPPPPPFPDPGCDPTEDDLTCGEEPQVKQQ